MKAKMRNRIAKWSWKPETVCPNCRGKTREGHFVSPSLGEPGFFICKEFPPKCLAVTLET